MVRVLGVSDLIYKYYARLKSLTQEKHTSLVDLSNSDDEKTVLLHLLLLLLMLKTVFSIIDVRTK
jgi:hypothetical protein